MGCGLGVSTGVGWLQRHVRQSVSCVDNSRRTMCMFYSTHAPGCVQSISCHPQKLMVLVSVYNCKLPPLHRGDKGDNDAGLTSIRATSTFFIIHCKFTPVQSMAKFTLVQSMAKFIPVQSMAKK